MSVPNGPPPPPVDRFFNNLKYFAGDLYTLGTRLNNERKITISPIKLNAFYNYLTDAKEARNILIDFIKSSYPHWSSISKQEEGFLGEDLAKTLFPKIESSDASQILKLINDPLLAEDKKNIWAKVISFAKIGIMFTYLERGPVVLGTEKYRNSSFLPEVDVFAGAKLFGIDLSKAF